MDTHNHFDVPIKYKKDGTPKKNSLKTQEYIERDKAVIKKYDENPELKLHHCTARWGFLSRKNGCIETPYSGRFGDGFTVDIPNYGTGTKWHERRYYVYIKDEKNEKTIA